MITWHATARGFTLVEMVIVIAITGAIAAAVALFLRWPFQSYLDVARRAAMSDLADTALRRIGRDLRGALPNSVRTTVAGGVTCVEMLPTITGGRYRAAVDAAGNGDILDFNTADASFDMFGPLPALPGQTIAVNQRVVVYNLGAASAGSDAYSGTNTNVIAATAAGSLPNENKITFSGVPQRFPLESPGARFHIISTPVSYACAPGAGTLTRYSGYGIGAAQQCPPGGGTAALLANNVSACNIVYTPAGATARNGLVSMQLDITQSNETVTLYHEVHVSNTP
jgi:MSHA biogenesis protein MshO